MKIYHLTHTFWDTKQALKENLAREKAELYEEIAAVNREIREQRKKLEMCAEIQGKTLEIEANLQRIEPKRRERRKTRVGR